MAQNNIAIYPGSFDPITNGHVDLVERTLRVFDRVIVAIATNPGKDDSLFSLDERLEMVREVFKALKGRVQAESFEGLLVDYAERKRATVIIRGLRAISDGDDESAAQAEARHFFHDDRRIRILHQFTPGQGSGKFGR